MWSGMFTAAGDGSSLTRAKSAIDRQDVAGDEAGGWRGEEASGVRDVVDAAPASHQRLAFRPLLPILGSGLPPLGFDPTRREAIDAHLRRDAAREAARESHDGRLDRSEHLARLAPHAG